MIDKSKFVLRWEIDNAKARFATRHIESEVFNEGGFKWTLALDRRADPGGRPNHDTTGATLTCGVNHNRPWKCEAIVEMIALRSDGTECMLCQQGLEDCIKIVMDHYKIVMEFRIFIISSERGELIADPFKFDVPNNRSDVILLFGDTRGYGFDHFEPSRHRKLHVSKEYLAMHSPVFETIFFGDFSEKGKEEIEMKDVVCEKFVDLLHVIYPGTVNICDSTVLHVLALGDRFQMERVVDLAQSHLLASKSFTSLEKLRFADLYRLGVLRDNCLNSYSSVREISALESSPEYANFSDAMKAAICDRVMKLAKLQN